MKVNDIVIQKSQLLKTKLKEIIEEKNFEDKFDAININGGNPITFSEEDNVKEGKPRYSDANKLGKSGPAVAVISKNTISRYNSDHIEYPEPINWKNWEKSGIFQRCHIIGYNLSAKFSDFNNIFIGTQNLNTNSMKDIESEVLKLVKNDGRTILYKVSPLYMFERDIIPFGVLFEYKSIDKKEEICGCKFCYNIQKDYKINYFDGSNKSIDNISMENVNQVKKPEVESKVSSYKKEYKNYYLNIKTNVFHIVYDEKEKCEELKGVQIKYIQEVTGSKDEVKSARCKITGTKFKICKKCEKIYNKKIHNNRKNDEE